MYRRTEKKLPKLSNTVMEEQFTHFICITCQETEWQCTFNEKAMNGAVYAKANSPHTKCMDRKENIAKNSSTFQCSNGPEEQSILMLQLYN